MIITKKRDFKELMENVKSYRSFFPDRMLWSAQHCAEPEETPSLRL